MSPENEENIEETPEAETPAAEEKPKRKRAPRKKNKKSDRWIVRGRRRGKKGSR